MIVVGSIIPPSAVVITLVAKKEKQPAIPKVPARLPSHSLP